MIVLPADHVINDTEAFQKTLITAAAVAEETGALVTIGVKPTWACPGFGYIEQGKPIYLRKRPENEAIHRVMRFREKPNSDLAEAFLRKGNFRWNAGMFVWSVPTVLREFNRHAPELADFISPVRAPQNFEKALRERFSKLPRISFDYAIMEKADRVLVVEASFDWDDVGSWRAVANYFKKDRQGNATKRAITAIDSSNNIVFEEHGTTVALLGVRDLIVVRTQDALLICHRHEAERDFAELTGKIPPELQYVDLADTSPHAAPKSDVRHRTDSPWNLGSCRVRVVTAEKPSRLGRMNQFWSRFWAGAHRCGDSDECSRWRIRSRPFIKRTSA
jgi:mannose-1-phosphate guanylyltransferase